MTPRSCIVTVTYHLHNPLCTAETCIDIPLEQDAAQTLVELRYGGTYNHLIKCISEMGSVLAKMRGYKQATIQDIRYAEVPL